MLWDFDRAARRELISWRMLAHHSGGDILLLFPCFEQNWEREDGGDSWFRGSRLWTNGLRCLHCLCKAQVFIHSVRYLCQGILPKVLNYYALIFTSALCASRRGSGDTPFVVESIPIRNTPSDIFSV